MDNLTAKISCFARAYHTRSHSVRVFSDAAAERLLGGEYDQIAQSMSQGIGYFLPDFRGSAEEGLRLIVDRQLSATVLGRSAYCEAVLDAEKRRGCRQYIVFASGYDTFAIRNDGASLSVFELDRPEMIADKKARIERAGLASKATYVPCDLSDAAWRDRLLESGFKRGARAFGSLLGISYYLDRDAFGDLLKALGGILCGGSAICLDYPSEGEGREARTNRALAQAAGEGMKARYSGREMEVLLEACGFRVCEHLGPCEMTDRFFSEHNRCCPERRMEAPEGVRYVCAEKKG